MKNILKLLAQKPALFEQSPFPLWEDDYLSKGMLKAHFDVHIESATRKLADVKKSVDWITKILPVEQYPNVLDLGCGPGIYAELLYVKGYGVKGIDVSKRSIAYAKQSAFKKKYEISYELGDYTKMNVFGQYHFITMIYCDFGVLSKVMRTQLLKKIYHALHPQGVFLFDVFTPKKYKDENEGKDWSMDEERFWCAEPSIALHAFYRYDEDHTYLHQYVIVAEEGYSYYHIWEHTFTLEEIAADLKEAGFQQITYFQDVTGESYKDGGTTICIRAQK